MLQKIKNFLYKFMYGRNGVDAYSNFLLIVSFFFLLLSTLIKSGVRYVFNVIFWLFLFYSYFRVFSKKIALRQNENQKFLSKINYYKTRFKQRKQYRFYTCPKCKTHLRVPKGVGKITVTCKKCGHQFDKKA